MKILYRNEKDEEEEDDKQKKLITEIFFNQGYICKWGKNDRRKSQRILHREWKGLLLRVYKIASFDFNLFRKRTIFQNYC